MHGRVVQGGRQTSCCKRTDSGSGQADVHSWTRNIRARTHARTDAIAIACAHSDITHRARTRTHTVDAARSWHHKCSIRTMVPDEKDMGDSH